MSDGEQCSECVLLPLRLLPLTSFTPKRLYSILKLLILHLLSTRQHTEKVSELDPAQTQTPPPQIAHIVSSATEPLAHEDAANAERSSVMDYHPVPIRARISACPCVVAA